MFGTLPSQIWEYVRSGAGTLAEYVVVQADVAAVVPEGMGMEDAGGLGGSGMTAIKMCEVDEVSQPWTESRSRCGERMCGMRMLDSRRWWIIARSAPLPTHLTAIHNDRAFDVRSLTP